MLELPVLRKYVRLKLGLPTFPRYRNSCSFSSSVLRSSFSSALMRSDKSSWTWATRIPSFRIRPGVSGGSPWYKYAGREAGGGSDSMYFNR
jgi:hypothetical protein